ncbi:thioesterase domain-containing protein [Paraburkholderia aspalathi]|uniref:thioesterase domain-containing protein n=1 Tax=Paraburkholderia aspalathi TaxID=1324617 RepID=UPI0038B748ED
MEAPTGYAEVDQCTAFHGDPICPSLELALQEYEVDPMPFDLHEFSAHVHSSESSKFWTKTVRSDRLHQWRFDGAGGPNANAVMSFGAQLARALQASVPASPVGRAGVDYFPLMPIQSGIFRARPYLCIPGAGASVIDFVPFAGAVGVEHDVFGMQPRGMHENFVPHGSVEEAANAYVYEIERLHRQIPLHLVGHSFGGWVAFEVALRLRALGREVLSLTLLDSEAPTISTLVGHEYTRAEALAVLVCLYEQAADQSLGLRREDFEGVSASGQLTLLHRQLVRVGLLPRITTPKQLQGTVRCFLAALRTRYCPSMRLDIPVYLVWARHADDSSGGAALQLSVNAQAWRLHAPLLRCRSEASSHVTLLKMPHIASVAQWLHSLHVLAGHEMPISIPAGHSPSFIAVSETVMSARLSNAPQ